MVSFLDCRARENSNFLPFACVTPDTRKMIMIPVFQRITFAQSLSATALVAALLSTPTSAQDIVEVERDAVGEANRTGEISIETRTGPIAAPAGVFVAAPDEEIIVAPKKAGNPDAPKPPAVSRKKAKAKDGGADSDMERRLERIDLHRGRGAVRPHLPVRDGAWVPGHGGSRGLGTRP